MPTTTEYVMRTISWFLSFVLLFAATTATAQQLSEIEYGTCRAQCPSDPTIVVTIPEGEIVDFAPSLVDPEWVVMSVYSTDGYIYRTQFPRGNFMEITSVNDIDMIINTDWVWDRTVISDTPRTFEFEWSRDTTQFTVDLPDPQARSAGGFGGGRVGRAPQTQAQLRCPDCNAYYAIEPPTGVRFDVRRVNREHGSFHVGPLPDPPAPMDESMVDMVIIMDEHDDAVVVIEDDSTNYDTLIEAVMSWQRVYETSAQLPEEYSGSEGQFAIEMAIDLLSRLPADRSIFTDEQRSRIDAIETWLSSVSNETDETRVRNLIDIVQPQDGRRRAPMRRGVTE